jgi:NDP-sugar pyrophosphorylase family protein
MSRPVRKAMLLAAGSATRLGPLASRVPKPMLPVGGRPLIEHTVRQLVRYGVEDIVINVHQRGDVVASHFGDGSAFGVRIHYSEEPELLGTAGGVRKCAPLLDETFLVVYGDNLTTCRFEALVDFHRAHAGVATIALFWRDDVSAHSAVERHPDGRIVRFVEKPKPEDAPSHWISAGVIVFEPAVFRYIDEGRPVDFGFDVFPSLLRAGEAIYGYEMGADEGLWWIDTPEHYERVTALWSAGFPGG